MVNRQDTIEGLNLIVPKIGSFLTDRSEMTHFNRTEYFKLDFSSDNHKNCNILEACALKFDKKKVKVPKK